ncbi:hypothetical protein Cyagr_1314 [Cyanobium gracile PCC 6307]|uniref:Uncharacterized protein n=1 Tax=Cyanobium gracile (strain ATCC 27147 / PCC 6307) TaxID=292564 RepID=K9P5U5_CYAGP|nr:hypothetical protein Cyagr_1314 [Cyanobium gracile PCC 6307]
MDSLSDEGRATEPNTPEREAVLERWTPIIAAVMALMGGLDDSALVSLDILATRPLVHIGLTPVLLTYI